MYIILFVLTLDVYFFDIEIRFILSGLSCEPNIDRILFFSLFGCINNEIQLYIVWRQTDSVLH
jgi:hypothetical protein